MLAASTRCLIRSESNITMDNPRLLLFMGLALVMLLLYQAWMQDYGPKTSSTANGSATATVAADGSVPTGMPAAVDGSVPGSVPGSDQPRTARGGTVHVVTDRLAVDISTLGGDLRRVDLPTFPVSIDQPDIPFRILDDGADLFHIAQSGLLAASGEAPNHTAEFVAEQNEYKLAEGADTLVVPLRWRGADGLEVEKRFTFHRDSYLIDVDFVVTNTSGEAVELSQYRQLQRTEPQDDGQAFIYTYTGGVIYNPEDNYEKIDFDDMADKPMSRDFDHGWAAMIQHYFLVSWIPDKDETNRYETAYVDGGRYLLRLISPAARIEAGASETLSTRIYIGPKEQARLRDVAEGLKLTVDYGVLTFIAQPIYWLMEKIHGLVGNWGWTIILLTMLIKAGFYKLSETSYRSMANMRKMTPKLTALRERYGDDKQRLQQAMMEIYKKEKINPLGGCLPIVIQIPVFIALYWVLLESVELRQAPWIFWINDLSTKDPFFVLPIVMGASMLVQQRLNPPPADPMQQKIIMALPIVFTAMFLFFPSGLVLYWVVNNLLSITQQWIITKRVEAGVKD